jgi:hypothetical protein
MTRTISPTQSDRETAPSHASAAALLTAVRPDAVVAFFDAFADLVAARLAARLGKVEQARHYYTKANLPPGAKSWRAARETAAREAIEVVRAGRDVLIVASSWDEYLARRTSRRGPVEIRSGDEAALAKMGVRLRGLPGGRR